MSVILYELEGCPYCETVADALEARDVEYESVWVEGLHSKRDEVKRVSGQRQVPVLVDEERGVTMAESENIVEFLEATYDGNDSEVADDGNDSGVTDGEDPGTAGT